MILPNKHLSQERALFTVGAQALKLLNHPRTVSSLWEEVSAKNSAAKNESKISYDWFVLCLDLLFLLGAIQIDQGLIKRMPSAEPL